jgi:hypothetical protein
MLDFALAEGKEPAAVQIILWQWQVTIIKGEAGFKLW